MMRYLRNKRIVKIRMARMRIQRESKLRIMIDLNQERIREKRRIEKETVILKGKKILIRRI